MPDKLLVGSVQAKKFGGLGDRRLEIPDAPMVVIHGPNETGKSTLTELITWLLVGPSSDTKLIGLLGDPGETLSGVLAGRLRNRLFTVSGDFRITPKSNEIAKNSTVTHELDGGLITPDEWQRQLKDIDRAAMIGVYRLWGQQLHDGGDSEAEMRRAGLGAISMKIDPRDEVEKLLKQSKRSFRIGADGTSVDSIRADLRKLDKEIAQASSNADQHGRQSEHLAEIQAKYESLTRERTEVQQRLDLLERLREVDGLRRSESEAKEAVRDCEAVPEAWSSAIAEIHRLRSLLQQCEDAEATVDEAKKHFVVCAAAVGVGPSITPAEVIDTISIREADTAAVAAAVRDVEHARELVSSRDAGRRDAASVVDAATDEMATVLDGLGATAERVRDAHLEAGLVGEATSLVTGFTNSQRDLNTARAARDSAQVAVDVAAHELAAVEHHWDQLGVGIPINKWRARHAGGTQPAVARITATKIAPLFLLAIPGVVALATGQWLVAAMLVFAAVVTWILGRQTRVTTDDSVISEVVDRFVEAENRLGDAQRALAESVSKIGVCDRGLGEARQAVGMMAPRMGIDLPDDPMMVADAVAAWSRAQKLVIAHDRAVRDLETAEGQLRDARAVEAEALSRLDSLLTGYGLPAGVPAVSANEIAVGYAKLTAAGISAVRAQETADTIRAEVSTLLGPAADEVSSWNPSDIRDRAESLLLVAQTRQEAVDAAAKASEKITDFVGHHHELAALMVQDLPQHVVDARIAEASRITAELDKQIHDLAETTGALKVEIAKLAEREQLADLLLIRGSLEETLQELATQAATRRLAALVLSQVIDEFERENQPDLVRRTEALALSVASDWSAVKVKSGGAERTSLMVRLGDGTSIPAAALSTGARAVLYLSLRVAMAEQDTQERGLAMPLICDDPLVHIDDGRAEAALGLLKAASAGRQVLMFTCHERTVEVAQSIGVTTHRI